MKFVALISGGKDSCFNISHCQQNGHELVAAASLRPKDGIDELDSYLYQTVGQDAIEYVGQALDVPLYRRVITGTAVELSNEYGTRIGTDSVPDQSICGDETEDLFILLREVKRNHPEVEGVSVGAILSTYQRVRVQHVCRRLGLTALSYLWQRDQDDLLQEMINANVNAVLIKVAGIGLKKQHLGQSLASMQSTLRALNERFGSHICGEGGEYETLTLDCPAFKKRIVLKETELVVLDDKDFATVAYLRIKSAILEEKDSEYPESIVQSPSQLDSFGQSLYDTPSITPSSQNVQGANYENIASFNKSLLVRRGRWLAIGNVNSLCDASVSLTEEAQRCFQKIKDLLDAEHLDLTDIVHVTALLRTMDDFASFNQVYSTMFGTSPPARACVAVQLPTPYRISLECIVHETTDKQSRSALHVQGISYWAPANIGPYSQAILIDRTIFISGQIGLIPATMSLPTPSDFRKEIALSLQHAKRIADVLQYQNWEPQGFVVWLVDSRNVPSAIGIMMEVIRKESQTGIASPPVLFVVPEALPKGAMGEVQMLAHCKTEETLDQDELERPSPGMTLSILYFNNTEEISTEQSRDLRNALSLKIFHCTTLEREVQTFIDDLSAGVAITLIPVKGIYNGSFPFDPCRFAVVSTH